jgi:hypothetical protein
MRLPVVVAIVTLCVPAFQAGRDLDYAALFAQGIPYATFVEQARARASQWRGSLTTAKVDDAAAADARGLRAKRRILVVAEASCSDSVGTVPYLAKLAEAAPDWLELRIVDSRTGRAVMEAHRTPDGRAATPTIAVLDDQGRLVGAWSERPAELQKWYLGEKDTLDRQELASRKAEWYAQDAGRSTVAEVMRLILK